MGGRLIIEDLSTGIEWNTYLTESEIQQSANWLEGRRVVSWPEYLFKPVRTHDTSALLQDLFCPMNLNTELKTKFNLGIFNKPMSIAAKIVKIAVCFFIDILTLPVRLYHLKSRITENRNTQSSLRQYLQEQFDKRNTVFKPRDQLFSADVVKVRLELEVNPRQTNGRGESKFEITEKHVNLVEIPGFRKNEHEFYGEVFKVSFPE
ncbi:MAG: hypothetical protein Tsb0021_18180 [Chlamydiales bacterium]